MVPNYQNIMDYVIQQLRKGVLVDRFYAKLHGDVIYVYVYGEGKYMILYIVTSAMLVYSVHLQDLSIRYVEVGQLPTKEIIMAPPTTESTWR